MSVWPGFRRNPLLIYLYTSLTIITALLALCYTLKPETQIMYMFGFAGYDTRVSHHRHICNFWFAENSLLLLQYKGMVIIQELCPFIAIGRKSEKKKL
jgi:hypothetical protein